MEYIAKAYNIWEVGQRFDENGMPHQEDALYPGYGRCVAEDRLFVLCDGMGGHDHGEVASSVVCNAISESVLRQLRSGSRQFREKIFDIALAEAYDALDVNDTGAAKKMGTTMAMLCLYEKGYFIAHIGDTRVYHIRPGDDASSTQIMFSTSDHSLVNKLVASGKMSLAEARASTRRHVITRAMQPHMEVRPRADIEMSSDIRPGDYFLMATHGMINGLSESEIRQIFSREGGGDREKYLKLRQVTANNRDNHSAVIVHIESVKSSRNSKNMATLVQREGADAGADTSTSKGKMNSMTNPTPGNTGSKGNKGNFGSLISRLMIGVLAFLSVVMVIYYAFIRKDEAMLEVDRSSVSSFSDYDPNKYEEEQFGYETKVSEVIDDRVIDDGSSVVAEETPVEEVQEVDESQIENSEKVQEPAPEPTQTPEPVTEPDVPILQE